MRERKIDLYIVPPTDPHQSEFIHERYKAVEYLSGFTGEAAWMLFSLDHCWIWVDGRFYIQAEKELAGTGIEIMKFGMKGVPSLIEKVIALVKKRHSITLGYDGRMVGSREAKIWESKLGSYGVRMDGNADLLDEVWEARPQLIPSSLYALPLSSSGLSAAKKKSRIQRLMIESGVDWLLLSDLSETAWFTNLRGTDVACTPVFYAYTLISSDPSVPVQMFLPEGATLRNAASPEDENPDNLSFISVMPYDSITETIRKLPNDHTIWMDAATVNAQLFAAAEERHVVLNQPTPVQMMKAVKNDAEIASQRQTLLYDGCAMVEFIHWLKTTVKNHTITEIDAANHLAKLRLEKPGCFDLSFPTVSAYAENSAIIHYMPNNESDTELKPEGFLLVDSGGQYTTGTTDITRTIALGELTDEMKDVYTRVLKAHIALATAHLGPDDSTVLLDKIARKPLQDAGMDFPHGVSHGIGHVLAVHEGPNIISPRRDAPMMSGMIQSNEPGCYLEGKFGVRLENEILCCAETPLDRYFETLTLCPFDRDAIIPELLTEDELNWLNAYHRRVEEALSPMLHKEVRKFLQVATAPL